MVVIINLISVVQKANTMLFASQKETNTLLLWNLKIQAINAFCSNFFTYYTSQIYHLCVLVGWFLQRPNCGWSTGRTCAIQFH